MFHPVKMAEANSWVFDTVISDKERDVWVKHPSFLEI
jgi:hypothetical protein